MIADTLWTFDQLQGVFKVVVPIRMCVIRLEAGGLLVYAPVAPTRECLERVGELVDLHGPVRYIVLPTASGLEHKVFVGPFARYFPEATVFVTPNQWSFPLNLPLSWLGLPGERTRVLPADSRLAPFYDEFDYALLGPIELGLGRFEEAAFLHRRSHTLLVTDSVVSLPEEPPAIVQLDPHPLLFHARDSAFDPLHDSPGNRQKGWWRIALFTCYFRPGRMNVALSQWRNAARAPERSSQTYYGLYPFNWQPDWAQSFVALRGEGRLFVAPVLQTLIFNRATGETLAWADRVAGWSFERVVPCHFDAPVAARAQQFRQAFDFLEPGAGEGAYPLPAADLAFMYRLEKLLAHSGILPPAR